jgi:hypothetical protein
VRALLHLAEKALITKYIVQCAIKALCCSAGRKTRAKKVRAGVVSAGPEEREQEAINIKRKSTSSHAKSQHSGVNTTPLLKRRSPAQLCACLFNPKSISNQYSRRDAFAQGRTGVAAVSSLRWQLAAIYVYACVRKRLYRAVQTMQRFMDTRRVTRSHHHPTARPLF